MLLQRLAEVLGRHSPNRACPLAHLSQAPSTGPRGMVEMAGAAIPAIDLAPQPSCREPVLRFRKPGYAADITSRRVSGNPYTEIVASGDHTRRAHPRSPTPRAGQSKECVPISQPWTRHNAGRQRLFFDRKSSELAPLEKGNRHLRLDACQSQIDGTRPEIPIASQPAALAIPDFSC